MDLFSQALALFSDLDQINIDTARQLQKLQDQAHGLEQQRIGSLWETFITRADDETFNQAWEEELI